MLCWTHSFTYQYCVEMAPPNRRTCHIRNCMDRDDGLSPYRMRANLPSEDLVIEDMKMYMTAHSLSTTTMARSN